MRLRPLLALPVAAATLAGAATTASPVQAASCIRGVVCLYDAPGWKGLPRTYSCSTPSTNQSLGTFSRRVSSVINNCSRQRVILSDFDRIQPTGLRPRITTILGGQWVWTLGGVRGMDNRARVITIR